MTENPQENALPINGLQKFLFGVEVIKNYEIHANMNINSGFIEVGSYDACYRLMPDEKRALMKSWGWMQGYDCWAFYVDGE